MTEKRPATINVVSTKQMKDVIQRSGYLLEQRVEQVFTEAGFKVLTNPVYPDPETGKTREIDIVAFSVNRVFDKGFNAILPVLLCECENNSQPIVFFTKKPPLAWLHDEEVKVSGIPVKFWEEDRYISLYEFTDMEKFHHYCKRPVATQYCTFQLKKDKSSWIALHSEEQHDTFNSLVKVLEYEIGEHFEDLTSPRRAEKEEVDVRIYYPLVILQGGLYSGLVENNRLTLRKSKHVQFHKGLFLPGTNKLKICQIDVISEEYLRDYLKIIDSEMVKIKKVFQRQRQKVTLSIWKIVEQAKSLKKKSESYREYLEFMNHDI